MTVLATVLTHSAPDALTACIRALRAQEVAPDAILVVDNAGTPAAADTLAMAGLLAEDLRVLRLPSNSGPAGGHAAALADLLASRHDLAWVMDDDCAPEPACLALLLAHDASGDAPVFRFPVRVAADGATDKGPPAWSGVLVGRDVIAAAGLPRAELFWWAEDTEYLRWRIPGRGVPRVVVPGARVHHSRARTATGGRPAWRYYYEARNTVYLRSRTPGRRSLGRILKVVGRLLGRGLIDESDRARKVWYVVRGTVDGVAGRLGPTILPPEPHR